jgi:hypothetical protein
MEAMLNEGAKAYVNHPRGVRWDRWGMIVSSIYHWFQVDFGGTDAGVITHLKKYASQELAQKLEKTSEIHNHEYSWDLNIDSAAATSEKNNSRLLGDPFSNCLFFSSDPRSVDRWSRLTLHLAGYFIRYSCFD